MKEIEKNELNNINGGGFSPWLAMGFGALCVFIIGVYDGITRPLACRK